MLKKFGVNKEELSWILYDVGNSAFVLIMITAIMPIYFKDVAAYGVPSAVSTSHWGFANSAAALILAVLSPILGALADHRERKKRFMLFFILFGLFFTILLTFISKGQWLVPLAVGSSGSGKRSPRLTATAMTSFSPLPLTPNSAGLALT